MSLRARQNGGGKVRNAGGRGGGNGSPGGRGNSNSEVIDTFDPANLGAAMTLSNGNKTATGTSFSNFATSVRQKAQSSGKWYVEYVIGTFADINGYVGPVGASQTGGPSYVLGHVMQNASGVIDGGGTGSNGSSWTTGDIIGVALDMSGASGCTCSYYKNGVANGSRTETTTTARKMGFYCANTGTHVATIRTTTAEFSYSPPSGYLPWGAS